MWKSVITALSGLLGNSIQNVVNVKQQRETNKLNEKLVQMQNEASAQQAELSYQRSRADNQVANMMNAGMSRAGAINALNGGGHYQPAPVNTSQANAPQIDTSSAINAIQEAANLKHQRDVLKQQKVFNFAQLRNQREMHSDQLASNEHIAKIQADAAKYGHDKGYEGTVYSSNKHYDGTIYTVDKNAESSKYHTDKMYEIASNQLEFQKSVHDFFKDAQKSLLNAQTRETNSRKSLNDAQRNMTKKEAEQLEIMKPLLAYDALADIIHTYAQVVEIGKMADLKEREYQLNKLKISFESRFGKVDALKNSILFWKDKENSSSFAGKPVKIAELAEELEMEEEQLFNYFEQLEKLLNALE